MSLMTLLVTPKQWRNSASGVTQMRDAIPIPFCASRRNYQLNSSRLESELSGKIDNDDDTNRVKCSMKTESKTSLSSETGWVLIWNLNDSLETLIRAPADVGKSTRDFGRKVDAQKRRSTHTSSTLEVHSRQNVISLPIGDFEPI